MVTDAQQRVKLSSSQGLLSEDFIKNWKLKRSQCHRNTTEYQEHGRLNSSKANDSLIMKKTVDNHGAQTFDNNNN